MVNGDEDGDDEDGERDCEGSRSSDGNCRATASFSALKASPVPSGFSQHLLKHAVNLNCTESRGYAFSSSSTCDRKDWVVEGEALGDATISASASKPRRRRWRGSCRLSSSSPHNPALRLHHHRPHHHLPSFAQ